MKSLLSSLRGRLLLSILLWVALGIGAIWFSSIRLFTVHVESQYHEELEVHVRELGELTALDDAGRPYLTRPLSDPRYAEPLSGFYWRVARPGSGSLQSPSMTRGTLDYDIAHSSRILHRVADGPTGRAIAYGFIREAPGGSPIHFVIATDERHLHRIIRAFTRELTVWLALLAIALVASGIAIITLGFRPFKRLSTAIEMLRNGEAVRVEGTYPVELDILVTDLNAYVERNNEIVARGRVQASTLAHSLRTPLAVITDEAERMQEGPRPGAADVLLDQSERMQRQIDYHLARVRSGGTKVGVSATCRVQATLQPLLTALRRCHPDKVFHSDVAEGICIAMDADDLNEILSNVLDNAAKWAKQNVTVSADAKVIRICDDGPGIAPEFWQSAFEIGHTGGNALGGAGLGLAIARSIARDYGGDVVMTNLPYGQFCVNVLLAD